jgi:glycerol kinase
MVRAAHWEKAIAVAESIVFLLKVNIEAFAKIAQPCAEIQVSGGLARLDGLCQRLADVTAVRVYRPAEAEATARGLAFLVADMPHEWPEPGPGTWFTPAENSPLQERYARWRSELERSL